jgi:hypothetical protein
MKTTPRPFPTPHLRVSAWLPIVLALIAIACGGGAADDPGDPGSAATAPGAQADRYAVRGEVVSLPASPDSGTGFYVRHEAIDDFKDADGNVVGMDAMTMQFPLSDPSLLEGVAVGDKVELVYLVDWHGGTMQDVGAVTLLSPDVELEFREARPPTDEPEGQP